MQGLDVKVQLGEFKPDVWALTSQLGTNFSLIGTAEGDSKIVGCDLINASGTSRTVSLLVVPSGETAPTGSTPASNTHYVLKDFAVGAATTERWYSESAPLYLKSGDKVYALASAGTAVHARFSVLEPRG